MREGALSGLRGREASSTPPLLAAQMTTTGNATNAVPVLPGGARGTPWPMGGKAQPFEDISPLPRSSSSQGSAAQFALVKGLATSPAASKPRWTLPKLVWLDPQTRLTRIAQAAGIDEQAAAATLSATAGRIAWPGKPGAPEPPKIVPLTEAQTALFEKGRVTYNTLCAACHQPHGFGLDGLAPPLVDSEWVLGKPDVTARIVMHGLVGPLKVGSRTWNLAMPPLMQLTDEEIAGVLTYIRREWDHNASPVDTKVIESSGKKHGHRTAMDDGRAKSS